MNTVDLFEIEHKVHQWVTQLGIAAAHQNWSRTENGVQKYGLNPDTKAQLGSFMSGSLLDESNDTPLHTKMSVWEHVVSQFAAEVVARDFPMEAQSKKGENSRVLNGEKIWGCLCQLYVQELDLRNKINNSIANRLQSGKPLKM